MRRMRANAGLVFLLSAFQFKVCRKEFYRSFLAVAGKFDQG
jgi:hypothetical protein